MSTRVDAPPRRTVPARPRALALTGGGLVALGVALLLMRWAAVPDSTGWIALQTLSPLGVLPLLAGVACLAVGRSLIGVLASVPGIVLAGALAWPAVHRVTVPPLDDDLTVLSANLRMGHADAHDLWRRTVEVDADVVVLVEVTPGELRRLDAQGLAKAYPHRAGRAGPRASGLVIVSRRPMTVLAEGDDGRSSTPVVRFGSGPRAVVLRGVHPFAPTSPDLWRSDLAALQRWVASRPAGERLVVAGDLNATWSHPPLRDAASGLTDAAHAAGLGWDPTWPRDSAYPPFAQIDHVLVRSVPVVSAGTVEVPGSDHDAVWARLRVR